MLNEEKQAKIYIMLETILNWDFWNIVIWNNTVFTYIKALFLFILFLLILHLFQSALLNFFGKKAKKTKTEIDDALIKIVATIKPPFYWFLAFYLALQFVVLHQTAQTIIDYILLIWVVYQAVQALQILIDFIVRRKIAGRQNDPNTKAAVKNLGRIAQFSIWIIGFLFVLSNMGINITSFIAGLGITGIAVAFALQNVLGDIFASFAIYFDRPFVIGDYIESGDKSGTVEKVGIKSTRLRSSHGEELIISNQELTNKSVHNYGQMKNRRVVFSLNISPQTEHGQLEKVNKIIIDILKKQNGVELDRVHLKDITSTGFNFEAVYYLSPSDIKNHLDVKQNINLEIKQILDKEKIQLAFPDYYYQNNNG